MVFERRVVVQQLLTGEKTSFGRVLDSLQRHERQNGWTCPQPPLPSVDDRGAGKRSVLVYVDDDGEEHPHLSQSLLYQLSNTATVVESLVECKCFSARNRNCSHLPMERFFTRRVGLPATNWPERHAEEDFLAFESTHGPCVTGWPRSRHPQRTCRRRSGQAGGAMTYRSWVKGVLRWMALRLLHQWSL